jgi:hypothetical protein
MIRARWATTDTDRCAQTTRQRRPDATLPGPSEQNTAARPHGEPARGMAASGAAFPRGMIKASDRRWLLIWVKVADPWDLATKARAVFRLQNVVRSPLENCAVRLRKVCLDSDRAKVPATASYRLQTQD